MGTWLREARNLAVHWIFEIKRLMSLRQQAKILGIAPSYLSRMVSGKRPWNPDVRERYNQLVNTVVNTNTRVGDKKLMPRKGLEPPLSYQEADFKFD